MRVTYERAPDDGTIPRLRLGHQYLVVGFDDEFLRVMDDACEPVLYPRECFETVDASIPVDWVRRDFEDGEFHVDPPECAKRGFYEDYFDHKPEAVATFNHVLARLREADAPG